MSREVDDDYYHHYDTPADRSPLLTDLNVQTKRSLRCVDSVVDLKEKSNTVHPSSCPERRSGVSLCAAQRDRDHNKCSGCRHETAVYVSVLLSGLALLLFGCLLGYTFHRERHASSEVRDLKERFEKLSALCSRQPAKQWSNYEDDGRVAVAGDDARGVVTGREVVEEGGLLWRQLADLNPAVEAAASGLFGADDSRRNQGNSRRALGVRGQDEEAAEDDEDEDENAASDDADEDGTGNDGDKHLGEILPRVRRSPGPTKANKKRRKSRGDKFLKKYTKCKGEAKEKKPSKKCRKTVEMIRTVDFFLRDNPPPPMKPAFRIKAVHFMSDFWNGRRKHDFGKDVCKYIEEWGGTACRNRTVRIRDNKTPLKFLHPADWMGEIYKDQSEQPIRSLGDGGYNVTESGLYLIYSSVMFHDIKPRQSQAVVVNGHKLFKCMDSVDYIDTDLPSGSNQAKYKTCAMTGVTHLKAGDRLEVQNLYANTEIDLSKDATYFGAVLLSPGEISE